MRIQVSYVTSDALRDRCLIVSELQESWQDLRSLIYSNMSMYTRDELTQRLLSTDFKIPNICKNPAVEQHSTQFC